LPIRKARTSDVREIQKLVNAYAKRHKLIQRSLSDLYERVRDILVYEENGELLGTCSMHVVWEDLAEIRSLAVRQDVRKKGIGRALVRAALKDALKVGIRTAFVLTFYPKYFERNFGFSVVDKSALPNKIWSDCLNCHLFPDCSEVALTLPLAESKPKARKATPRKGG